MSKSDSRTVKVDLDTFAVYPETGYRKSANRIGTVLEYVKNEGARTPSGGKFTSHRITVKLTGDSRRWVGQFKTGETQFVKIRPLDLGDKEETTNAEPRTV